MKDIDVARQPSHFWRLPLIGSEALQSSEESLERTVLLGASLTCIVAGVAWSILYFIAGVWIAGIVPLAYSALSGVSFAVLAIWRNYARFRTTQLILILLMPMFMMIVLGTFSNSSGVILWSSLCPMGALLLTRRGNAWRWFMAFVAAIAVGAVLQHDPNPRLPGRFISAMFAMNLGGVMAIVFLMLRFFVDSTEKFQGKSEELLLNILPKRISESLKLEIKSIAEKFESATILFADCEHFTPLSAELSPEALVELLDEVFVCFDALVEAHGLEKIKTIGDCYMAAAGVPTPRADHATAMARFALDIQAALADRTFAGRRLRFRIGINSGPVVAGIIGRKKFIYDLWGDAVNTASRMESHGAPGAIQISRATFDLLGNAFICEPLGAIPIKGKGDMEAWRLVGVR